MSDCLCTAIFGAGYGENALCEVCAISLQAELQVLRADNGPNSMLVRDREIQRHHAELMEIQRDEMEVQRDEARRLALDSCDEKVKKLAGALYTAIENIEEGCDCIIDGFGPCGAHRFAARLRIVFNECWTEDYDPREEVDEP